MGILSVISINNENSLHSPSARGAREKKFAPLASGIVVTHDRAVSVYAQMWHCQARRLVLDAFPLDACMYNYVWTGSERFA